MVQGPLGIAVHEAESCIRQVIVTRFSNAAATPGEGSLNGRRYSVESDEGSDRSSLEFLCLGVAERFIERFLLRLVVGD